MVKYAGAAYLIYLGIAALLSRERFVLAERETPPVGLGSVFTQAVGTS